MADGVEEGEAVGGQNGERERHDAVGPVGVGDGVAVGTGGSEGCVVPEVRELVGADGDELGGAGVAEDVEVVDNEAVAAVAVGAGEEVVGHVGGERLPTDGAGEIIL